MPTSFDHTALYTMATVKGHVKMSPSNQPLAFMLYILNACIVLSADLKENAQCCVRSVVWRWQVRGCKGVGKGNGRSGLPDERAG